MLRDTDFDPRSEEEIKAEEQDKELARRIRREVRRIQSGEADDEMERERCEEEQEQQKREQLLAQEQRRAASPLRGFITGNVLRQEWLVGNYRYPLIIAGVFLLSIIVMFWSLRVDMKFTQKEREVQLLRERAMRLKEQRNRISSHSAVVEELARRGISLQDPEFAAQIVED